jgi:hypothetical protein
MHAAHLQVLLPYDGGLYTRLTWPLTEELC